MSVTKNDILVHSYQRINTSLWFCWSGFVQKREFHDAAVICWKWIALTMSYNIYERQKRRDSCHLNSESKLYYTAYIFQHKYAENILPYVVYMYIVIVDV